MENMYIDVRVKRVKSWRFSSLKEIRGFVTLVRRVTKQLQGRLVIVRLSCFV